MLDNLIYVCVENKNLSKNDLQQIEEEIPLGKIGLPRDIAKCVSWMVDEKYTTGQIIGINGGWNIN